MKKIMRKWLGLDEEYDRLSGAILALNKQIENHLKYDDLVFDGESAKDGSLKEAFYELIKFLRLHPKREFYQEPAEVQTMVTKRKFWFEKKK